MITILLLVVIACKKESKPNSSVNTETITKNNQKDTFLRAKIDGKDFYSEELNYYSAYGIISLAAVSKDEKEKIRIYINYKKNRTTYSFGKGISNSDNMVYTHNKIDWLAAKTKGKGTITLTEEGGYLIGKFSFTGVYKENKSKKQITEGKFKVRIDS